MLFFLVEQWKQEHNLSNLGMPHYVASGSHIHKDSKYRFLILPRYEKDLETILQAKRKLNLKTVLTVSMQIIDILEYIHSKGYVHSDIKASNILLGRAETQQTTVVEKPVLYSRTSNPIRKCKFRVAPRVSCAKRSRRCVRDIVYWDDIPEFHEIEELMELNKYVVKEKKETKSAEQGDQVEYIVIIVIIITILMCVFRCIYWIMASHLNTELQATHTNRFVLMNARHTRVRYYFVRVTPTRGRNHAAQI